MRASTSIALVAIVLGPAVGFGVAIAVAENPGPSPQLLAAGKAVYESSVGCSACHGVTGQGNGPVAFSLKPPPRNFVKDEFKAGDSVEQVYNTITNGLRDTRMVGYPQVAEPHRWALAYYVLSFRKR
jgi:mono/diheme cytochrome c family protein